MILKLYAFTLFDHIGPVLESKSIRSGSREDWILYAEKLYSDIGPPFGLYRWPRGNEFHNLDRGVFGYHNHAFRVFSLHVR